jgi:CBS domain-containing protein
MDGGRMLRAVLATQMNHAKATTIAARIGQGIAVLFVIYGFFENPFLIFIGAFIFMGAQQEAAFAQMKAAVHGLRVSDAMITRFVTLPNDWLIARAVEEVLHDTQPVYPVTDSHLRVSGLVARNVILESSRAGDNHAVLQSLATVAPVVQASASFGEAFHLMQESGNPVLAVVNPSGQAVGLVSLNLLSERSRLHRA